MGYLHAKKDDLKIRNVITLWSAGKYKLEGRIIEVSNGSMTILRKLFAGNFNSDLIVQETYTLMPIPCSETPMYLLKPGPKEIFDPKDTKYFSLKRRFEDKKSKRKVTQSTTIESRIS